MVSCSSDRPRQLGEQGGDHVERPRRAISRNAESSDAASHAHSEFASDDESAGSDQCGRRRPEYGAATARRWRLKPGQEVKTGVKQMVTQAWDRHRRDQLAVSVSSSQVRDIFEIQWMKEMESHMREAFAMEVQFPNPFVTEVYTDVEPIAVAARKIGLEAGKSLTLGSGWDFTLPRHREAAKELIRRTKPYALVLAFPCGAWSILQGLNPVPDLLERREKAIVLVEFAIDLALMQLRAHRHFLMENPLTSAAWKLPCMVRFMELPKVLEVVVDMCAFGLRDFEGNLHRKATRLLSSSQALISQMIGARCSGDHPHAHVIGGSKITVAAGHYTPEFSKAVVRAFMDEYDFESRIQAAETVEIVKTTEVLVAEHADHEVQTLEDETSLDESDGVEEPSQSSKDVAIPAVIRQAVHRLHVNTDHRHPLRLARALLIAGAPTQAFEAAKRLRCSVCAERKPPKPRLPASLPPPREVGQQVHVDLLIIEDTLRRPHVVAHCTDNVSRFQAPRVLNDKSTAEMVRFLTVHWLPLLGAPHTIVADQGREFISAEFGDWCDHHSIYLCHIGLGAPWQNGIAERSGGTLKALTGAICASNTVVTTDEMQNAVSEAVAAYNADPNESGVSPLQLVTGRNPSAHGDVLNNFSGRLAEHSLLESDPSMAKQVAMRETARVAMVRLHYSQSLRRAELL